MEGLIGLDVYAASTTCAVIDVRCKRVRVDLVETNGQAPDSVQPVVSSARITCKYNSLWNHSYMHPQSAEAHLGERAEFLRGGELPLHRVGEV